MSANLARLMGSSFRAFLLGAAAFCLALPAFAFAGVWTAAGPAAAPGVTWNAPTPAEGARLQGKARSRVSLGLSAGGPGGPVAAVSIRAAGLPVGAAFQPSDGNPAT